MLITHIKFGTLESGLLTESCVTRCVTRGPKNGQIPDDVR